MQYDAEQEALRAAAGQVADTPPKPLTWYALPLLTRYGCWSLAATPPLLETRKVCILNVELSVLYQRFVTVLQISGDRYTTAFLRRKWEVTSDC